MFNRVIKKPGLYDIIRQVDGKLSIGRFQNLPDMSVNSSICPTAAFLGPHADNHNILTELANEVLTSIVDFRTGIWEGPSLYEDKEHKQSIQDLKHRFKGLLAYLEEHSTPFSSLRYLAHMTGDQLLPALAAYYAGMIYNSNNVTVQASTATTLLEMLAMRDLCDMVGFTRLPMYFDEAIGIPDHFADPWAHITSDGSIANIEAVWSARESKLLPFAALEALTHNPDLKKAANLKVLTCDRRKVKLVDAEPWELWNLTRDERLLIPFQIAKLLGLKMEDTYQVWEILTHYDINAKGWQGFSQYFYDHQWPIVLIPSTAHYSWPKSVAVMGLGTGNAQNVMVDEIGRMNLNELRHKLDHALRNKQPILMTVSVFGSTEESAVDPLKGIINLRDEYRLKGLDFDIHVDAAWGGYFISTIRKEFKMEEVPDSMEGVNSLSCYSPFLDDTRQVLLNDYVVDQAKAICQADSITIDPHKMGYVQYPAGTIMYKNGDVINLTTFTGTYIGSATDPTVGLFGLEGSRPGAAAAAVYFTHACLRPDYKGYGEVITRSLYNAKQFYAELLFIGHQDQFKTALLMPFDPSNYELVRDKILRKGLDEIRQDEEAMPVFRDLGPDQNIIDYGFNPIHHGVLNNKVDIYNQFTKKVYDKLRIKYDGEGRSQKNTQNQPELMLSMTTFMKKDYGDEFMKSFANQLGLTDTPIPDELNCLRSTIMSPFTSDIKELQHRGSYWPTLMTALADNVALLVKA